MAVASTDHSSNVRAIAVGAAARGWLDAGAAFDAGLRAATLGPNASAREVLGSTLSDAQLDVLVSSPGASEMETLAGSASLPVSSADGQGWPTREARATRYVPGALLGEGGMGKVISALDRDTGRTIALKTLRAGLSPEHADARRFLAEARITAQLEHPAIIPVYDLGALADDNLYYTMRIVRQRSLGEVLALPMPRAQWPLVKLCGVFVQVCRALAYAHARGVIHRDLKPENILLGEYGEVYVADWGVVKVVGEAAGDAPVESATAPTGVLTQAGSVVGTIGYMAPEQALGQADLDARADVFALGVVLYEILTGNKPFKGPSFPAVLLATMTQEPPAPRAHQPSCPVVLEELCLRMLAKDRAARPASAEDVAAEVDAFLDGAKERARRHAEAERLAAEAKTHAARHLALAEEKDLWQARALELLRDVKGWEPVEKKRPGWELEDRGRQMQTEYAGALAAAVERYAQALGYEQDNATVRGGLAALYWARAERCALERDEVGQMYSETLVREYDDGTFLAKLTADARVSIETPKPGAEVVAFRYVERDRIFRAEPGLSLGRTPIREARLAPGSYVLTIAGEGFRTARYPLVARRGEHHEAHVNLYTDHEIGQDLVYVPGGACVIGGDAEAFDGLPRQEIVVPDFAIGRFPITFDEYLAFINDLATRDAAAAEKRLPCASDTSEGLFVERDAAGLWAPKWEAIIDGEQGRAFAPRELVGKVPVCCIDWFDAVAYCRWRSERDGGSYRLLTEFEREKAARGVDGRWFPWGDRFDPTFCKMRESRPGSAQPEPVGAFPVDESPYGVRDLAGGMRDWVGDIANELTLDAALAEGEPPPGTPRDHSMIRSSRGGSWFALTSWCRGASRLRYASLYRSAYRGLRIARSLPPRG